MNPDKLLRPSLAACLVGMLVLMPAATWARRASPDWPSPTGQWKRGPLPRTIDHQALDDFLAVVERSDGELQQTREVVVIWRGHLVAERYAQGFGPEVRLPSWSMAKSITQALVGIAVAQGLVDIETPLPNPNWRPGDPHLKISWRQWLNMVDGTDFQEIDAHSIDQNDAADMLFGAGRFDVAAYAANLPIVHPPGSLWNYNSGGYDLVADALTRRLTPRDASATERRAAMSGFMTRELFAPIGMHSAWADYDAAGTMIGASLIYATARDFAKFGFLYLNDGVWQGRRLLPKGWVEFARQKTPASNCNIYGAGWWIVPAESVEMPFEADISIDAPNDTFYADGHDGQLLIVVPSKNLVIVRLGFTDAPGGTTAVGRWATNLIALFPTTGAEPK